MGLAFDITSRPSHPGLELGSLKAAYQRGENITQLLSESSLGLSRSEIIEIAYDLQAGSYSAWALNHREKIDACARTIYDCCAPYLQPGDCLLDCGAGELTALSAFSQYLPISIQLHAFDLSLSRIRSGLKYARQHMKSEILTNLRAFVAELASIPLATSSMDVVTTMHALEPNHGHEEEILAELLRVAKRKLILFEPSWENASADIQERMRLHGYVRGLPDAIRKLGGQLIAVQPLPEPVNLQNPTYCFIIEPPLCDQPLGTSSQVATYSCPRSNYPLQDYSHYCWSEQGGWCYPIIETVPCLRPQNAVLMTQPFFTD